MKKETKLKKQLATVEDWTQKARMMFDKYEAPKISMAFYTLIALEQMVKYEKMKLEE